MKTSKILLAMLGLLSGLGAYADNAHDDVARVRRVEPEYEYFSSPREECRTEYISERRSGNREYTGAVLGGLTGAAVGSQVGKGNGNKAAIVAGSILGAVTGDRLQNGDRDYDDHYVDRPVKRCHTVESRDRRLTGYRVEYEYAGRRYTTIMPEDPGRTLRVRVSVEPY